MLKLKIEKREDSVKTKGRIWQTSVKVCKAEKKKDASRWHWGCTRASTAGPADAKGSGGVAQSEHLSEDGPVLWAHKSPV